MDLYSVDNTVGGSVTISQSVRIRGESVYDLSSINE
jgi:hypothetical protein